MIGSNGLTIGDRMHEGQAIEDTKDRDQHKMERVHVHLCTNKDL